MRECRLTSGRSRKWPSSSFHDRAFVRGLGLSGPRRAASEGWPLRSSRALGGIERPKTMTGVTRSILAFAVGLVAAGCGSARVPQPVPYVPDSSYTPTSPEAEQRSQPVSDQDLRILDRAGEILSDPAKWDRQDDRICTPEDTTWSLFCALQRASIEILGGYDHRRVAIQEVRFAIEEAAPDQVFEHRLRDYNNLPTTRYEDVQAVLHVARERVGGRLARTRK